MRRLALWAAMAALAFGVRPALGATYTTDRSYQFPGQTDANSGNGLAVNSANTRLYAVKRSTTDGGVRILDADTGAQTGSISPPSPTTITSIALSPNNATVYFARPAADGNSYVIAAAPATDGDHAASAVTPVISNLPARPTGITVRANGSDWYMGIVTSPNLYIYKGSAAGAWTLNATVNLGASGLLRDVTALNAGAETVFYVLQPSTSPNVRAYNQSGSPKSVSFASLPAPFDDYYFHSIVAVPDVDGAPALFLSADAYSPTFAPMISVFRYTTTGAFTGEGFGYRFGGDNLSDLEAWDLDDLLVPMANAGDKIYVGGVLPDRFSGGAQTVRVAIGGSTGGPESISGTVQQATASGAIPAADAQVVVAGRSTPTDAASSAGEYTLTPLNAGTVTVSASKYGYAAATQTVALAAGEQKQNVDLTLSQTVPTFTLAPAYPTPILDGWTFPGEYPTPPMPLTLPGGGAPEGELTTTAYATHDADYLYVAVFANEPSLALNSAQSTNFGMLTMDDNVQIYLDPRHRHEAQAETSQLYQFAVNIPPAFGGSPIGTSYRAQRRVNPDGSNAGAVDGSLWTSRVGYSNAGWTLEARISLAALGLTEQPGPNTEWGLLVARYRPTTHNDNRPTRFSTSPLQTEAFTAANTWTDVRFTPATTAVKGDVNRNGVLDVMDAVYVLRMAGGLYFGNPSLTAENVGYGREVLEAADVAPAGAPDGTITLADAVRLMRAANGLETLP